MKYSYEQLSQQTALFLQLLSVERNLSNRTLNAYHSDLHCFMRWCRNSQVETLDQNTKNLPRTLTTAEIRQLISVADAQVYQPQSSFHKILNIRNSVILELLFCLGLRIGEISALNLV